MAVFTPLRTHTTAEPGTVLSNNRFFTVHKVARSGLYLSDQVRTQEEVERGAPGCTPKPNLKNRLCTHSNIKGFTWSTLQPKSTTETGWPLVHWVLLLLLLLLQLNFHSVAVVLTQVQTKQIRTNIHKRNNTKTRYKQIQNTVNTSTHITKTPTQLSKHPPPPLPHTHPKRNIRKLMHSLMIDQ